MQMLGAIRWDRAAESYGAVVTKPLTILPPPLTGIDPA
jgi:hypothetical protein